MIPHSFLSINSLHSVPSAYYLPTEKPLIFPRKLKTLISRSHACSETDKNLLLSPMRTPSLSDLFLLSSSLTFFSFSFFLFHLPIFPLCPWNEMYYFHLFLVCTHVLVHLQGTKVGVSAATGWNGLSSISSWRTMGILSVRKTLVVLFGRS